jgi:hypothetical protein
MSRERKLIRQRLTDRLKGRTAAGDNVFPSLATRNWGENLPAIMVYTRSEQVESELTKAPLSFKVLLNVSVEVHAKNSEDPSDELDDLCHEVEELIAQEDTLGGACEYCRFDSLETEFEANGEAVVGAARLNFYACYIKEAPRETSPLDDFKTANARWPIGGETTPVGEDDIGMEIA